MRYLNIVVISLLMSVLIYQYLDNLLAYKEDIKNRTHFWKSKIALILAYFVYAYSSSFRFIAKGFGGTDAIWYKRHYLNAIRYSFEHYLDKYDFESLFSLISWLVRRISYDYSLMLLIWHSFTFLCVVYFLKHFVNRRGLINLPVTLITVFLLFEQFNTLRNSIAIGIFLLVLTLYYKKKFILMTLFLLAGVFIHNSFFIVYLVFVVLFIVKKINFESIPKALVYILGILLVLVFVSFGLLRMVIEHLDKYRYYLSFSEISIAFPTLFISIIVFVLSLRNYQAMIKQNKFNELLIISFAVVFISMLLQALLPIMYRTVLYFYPISVSLILELFKIYFKQSENLAKKAKSQKYVILVLVLILVYRIVQFYTISIKNIM